MYKDRKLHLLVLTAIFAAAITVVTAYVLHIPIPTGGYVHLGDSLIYIAACLLPTPYAIGAAVVGAGLADLLTAPMWVLPTLLVKAVVVLPFTGKKAGFLCRRNVLAVFLVAFVSPLLYSVAACILLGGPHAFWPQFVGTLVQAAGSGAVFLVVAAALDRVKMKERFHL